MWFLHLFESGYTRLALSAQHTQTSMLLSSCHATCPQDVSAATALADAWPTEPDDDLGDDYARHVLTGEADAFHTRAVADGRRPRLTCCAAPQQPWLSAVRT